MAPPGRPPLATFNDVGAGVKGGLPYQPWAGQFMKKRLAEHGLDNPDSLCLPQGPLQFHLDPHPKEIIQLQHKTVIVHESNNFRVDGWLDFNGSPFTDALRLTDRTVPARQRRQSGDRFHGRRSQGLYEAVYRPSRASDCGRRLGADRVHLPREPDVPEDDRPPVGSTGQDQADQTVSS